MRCIGEGGGAASPHRRRLQWPEEAIPDRAALGFNIFSTARARCDLTCPKCGNRRTAGRGPRGRILTAGSPPSTFAPPSGKLLYPWNPPSLMETAVIEPLRLSPKEWRRYGGKHVAIVDDRVVAAGRNAVEAFDRARRKFPERRSGEIGTLFVPKSDLLIL